MTASWLLVAATLLCSGGPLLAATIELPGEAERTRVHYTCSDGVERLAEYVNSGENRLALVEIDGDTRLFVDVISGSGARYVTGSLVWWTKGREASLRDETAAEGSPSVVCEETDG